MSSTAALRARLPDDATRAIFDGAMRVAADKKNPIRLTLFAAGMREVFTRVLHVLAPDEEVRACRWFKQAPDTQTVTRRQRAIYATQGGLSDDFVRSVRVDVEFLHGQAIEAIDALSVATHVATGKIETDPDCIAANVRTALSALDGLLDSFAAARRAVVDALATRVYRGMAQTLAEETFSEIDLVAGRGYEIDEAGAVDTVTVSELTAAGMVIVVEGDLPVTLHYGRGDDSSELEHHFPFRMTFTATTDAPTALEYRDTEIDDSGWYE